MKKLCAWCAVWLLTLCVMVPTGIARENAENPVEQLAGTMWLASSTNEKEAFLLGVESAITIEFFVAAEMDKQAKKATPKNRKQLISTLSPFERGWIAAFDGVSRAQIVKDVDAWYTAHPAQMQRPALDVIWYEFIVPKTQGK